MLAPLAHPLAVRAVNRGRPGVPPQQGREEVCDTDEEPGYKENHWPQGFESDLHEQPHVLLFDAQ